jgi:hypothetical protein
LRGRQVLLPRARLGRQDFGAGIGGIAQDSGNAVEEAVGILIEMAGESIVRVRAPEEGREVSLGAVQARREAQRLRDGRMGGRQGLGAGGAALEVGGDAQVSASEGGALRP